MCRQPIATLLLPALLAGSVSLAGQDSGHLAEAVYPLYAIVADTPRDPPDSDLQFLARNFCLVQARFSAAVIKRLHEINPDFQVIHYFNSTYTSSADHVPVVEGRFRQALTMFRVANLDSDIDPDTREFRLAPVSERQSISLKASSRAGSLSSSASSQPSTRHYVTWIRVGQELMRIEAWDPVSGQISVTRGFDGSKAGRHLARSPVFSPVYLGSVNDTGAWPGGPGQYLRYAFDPARPAGTAWRLEQMAEVFEQGYDGFWLDICSASPFNMADSDGRPVTPWDFRAGLPYDKSTYSEGQQIKVHTIQNAIRKRFGDWPVMIANNMKAATFEPDQGGQRLMLIPTEVKPRPLDGYCIENYAGGFPARAADRAQQIGPRYHSAERWRANQIMLMKCAQEGLAAYPMIANAGSKSILLEGLGRVRDQFESFAYSSYLLCIERNSPTRLGLPAFYQEGGRRFAGLHPRYSWPIGAPVETVSPQDIDLYTVPGHLSYRRRFEAGIVVVNPHGKDDTEIRLGEAYLDPESNQIVQAVRMKANTGRILLRQ